MLLAIHWNFNPEIFHIGSLGIRWYSLLFVSGFIIGWFIFRNYFRREKVSEELLDPLLYTLLIATIVGARLGHCIFYQPEYYFGSWQGFLEIFQPWKGGLASHGGAIALVLAMIWYARHYGRRNGFDFFWIIDRLVITVCFAGALIRLGNLCNSEIYGGPTTLPWGMYFMENVYQHFASGAEPLWTEYPCHPTQLYEALSYLVLGLAPQLTYKYRLEKLYRGEIFGIFLICLFGVRFLIEFIKNDQVDFEAGMAINMGQILSIPFILAGVVILIYSFIRRKPACSDAYLKADGKKKQA